MNQALPLLAARQPIDGNGLQFGIDWFAFTAKGAQRVWVVSQLVELLGDEWREWQLVRRSERRERTRGPHGSLMEVDWAEKWVHVVIKGKGCRAVGTEAIVRLHEVLFTKVGEAYRAKRVDLAWDDYKKRVTPEQFRERFCDPVTRLKRPEVVCKARGGRAIVEDAPNGGGSYTIGRRESNRLLRVYDKAAESDGAVDAIRIELECKDRVAVDVMEALVSGSAECRSAAVVGFLVGFVDFRGGSGNASAAASPVLVVGGTRGGGAQGQAQPRRASWAGGVEDGLHAAELVRVPVAVPPERRRHRAGLARVAGRQPAGQPSASRLAPTDQSGAVG